MPAEAASAAHSLPPLVDLIGIWLAAFLTLAIYSFLYGDNPVYKFAEHIFVGVSAGYFVVIAYHEAIINDLIKPLFRPQEVGLERPAYSLIIAGVLGLMILARFIPRYDWLSRWPLAFLFGLGAGVSIPANIHGIVIPQLRETIRPLLVPGDWWTAFSNVLLAGGLICTLFYFFFSVEHKGALRYVARTGMFFLMVGFGAGFGNTVMARLSLLIGRIEFLRYEWWPTVVELFHRLVG